MKEFFEKNRILNIGVIFIWFYALISAIFRPLLNDNVVFYSWSQHVYNSPLSGIEAIESVWEIKGLFSRIIYYQLYWFTQHFCEILYPYGQYIYQAIGYLEICLIIYIALCLLPQNYLSAKEKIYSFFIISFSFFISSPMAVLQPEQWGICLLLLSFALLLREDIVGSVIGGIILGSTLFIKTPFLLLSGSVFFSFMLLKKINLLTTIKMIWLYALSSLVFIMIILGLLYVYYPIEIQDIKDASFYQSTLLSYDSIIQVIRELGHSLPKMWQILVYLPIIMVGLLSSVILISYGSRKELLLMTLIWLFPFLYVVISDCYFQYHFVTFFFPSFIAMYLLRDVSIQYEYKYIIKIGILSLLLGFLFSFKPSYFIIRLAGEYFFIIPYVFICLGLHSTLRSKALFLSICFTIFIFISWNSIISHMHRDEKREINAQLLLNANNNHYQKQIIENNDSILTLDAGISPLWIANPSYLRHFYPLPLQRTSDSSAFKLSQTYTQTIAKIHIYSGNVIIADTAWFYGNSKQQDIRDLINQNYYLADSIIWISNSGYNIFAKHSTNKCPLLIYKRKQ